MAAESAARLYANDEAVTHYTQAIKVAEKTSLDAPSQAALHRGRGLANERRGDFEQARADHEAALSLARSAGEHPIEWLALLDLGKLWASRDYDRTGEYFQQALTLARQMDDPTSLARSLNRVGNWHANTEHPLKGIRYHQEALDIFKRLGDRRALAKTLDLLGMAYVQSGDLLASADSYREAITLFQEVDDRPGLVSSMTTLAICAGSYPGQTAIMWLDPLGAKDAGEQALQTAREIGWRAGESYALWALASHYSWYGSFADALEAGQSSLKVATDIGHHQWMVAARATLGHIY
jgi:tetratricopeptide (TPR) repeat protein